MLAPFTKPLNAASIGIANIFLGKFERVLWPRSFSMEWCKFTCWTCISISHFFNDFLCSSLTQSAKHQKDCIKSWRANWFWVQVECLYQGPFEPDVYVSFSNHGMIRFSVTSLCSWEHGDKLNFHHSKGPQNGDVLSTSLQQICIHDIENRWVWVEIKAIFAKNIVKLTLTERGIFKSSNSLVRHFVFKPMVTWGSQRRRWLPSVVRARRRPKNARPPALKLCGRRPQGRRGRGETRRSWGFNDQKTTEDFRNQKWCFNFQKSLYSPRNSMRFIS